MATEVFFAPTLRIVQSRFCRNEAALERECGMTRIFRHQRGFGSTMVMPSQVINPFLNVAVGISLPVITRWKLFSSSHVQPFLIRQVERNI